MIKTLLIIYCSFAYGYGFSMFLDILSDERREFTTNKEVTISYLMSLGILLIFPIMWPILMIESIKNEEDYYGD